MTSTDRFLQFFFGHQLMMIEALFALILGICVVWLFVHLQKDDEDESSSTSKLEAILYKVLDKTNRGAVKDAVTGEDLRAPASAKTAGAAAASAATTAGAATPAPLAKPLITPLGTPAPIAATPAPAPVAPAKPAVTPIATTPVTPVATPTPVAAAPAPTPVTPAQENPTLAPTAKMTAELEKLKAENEEKEKKLAQLEKSLEAAKKAATDASESAAKATAGGSGANGADVKEFQKKIQDLESRLSEYEIIEDDIANLSLYKEENVRLKNELEKLKGEGGEDDVPESKAASTATAAVSTPSPQKVPGTLEEPAKDLTVDSEKLVSQAADLAAQPIEESAKEPAKEEDSGQKLIDEFENFVKGAGR